MRRIAARLVCLQDLTPASVRYIWAMSWRRNGSKSNSKFATRLCQAIFLVLALFLRAIDSGEPIFDSDRASPQVASATGHAFADTDKYVPNAKCLLTDGRSGASAWSTPESEGGYWATLTSSSFGDLAMTMPTQVRVAVPIALTFLVCAPDSYVRYLPHGPPGERTSRAPPPQRQLSRPLDA